jgi:hypothetical protein
VTVTLSEIRRDVEQISGCWRTQTTTGQRNDVSCLDDLLGELDDADTDPSAATVEIIDELRGRIEVLIDEIDISLGIRTPTDPRLPRRRHGPRTRSILKPAPPASFSGLLPALTGRRGGPLGDHEPAGPPTRRRPDHDHHRCAPPPLSRVDGPAFPS